MVEKPNVALDFLKISEGYLTLLSERRIKQDREKSNERHSIERKRDSDEVVTASREAPYRDKL